MTDVARGGTGHKPRTWLRAIISVAVTVAFTALFLRLGDPQAYLAIFRAVDWGWLTLLVLCGVLLGIVRGWRIALMLGRPLSRNLLYLTLFYNFLAAVVPARLGELALPLLLKREGKTSFSEAMGVLFATRLYDFITLLYLAGLCVAVLALQGVLAAPIGLLGALGFCVFFHAGPGFAGARPIRAAGIAAG